MSKGQSGNKSHETLDLMRVRILLNLHRWDTYSGSLRMPSAETLMHQNILAQPKSLKPTTEIRFMSDIFHALEMVATPEVRSY